MSELIPPRIPGQPQPPATTIVVAASHAMVRAGLRAVLENVPGFAVVGEAGDPATAVALSAQLRPAVVLLDELPDGPDGEETLAALRETVPGACVLSLGDRARAEGVLCVPSNAGVVELCRVLGVALNAQCAGCLLRARCAPSQPAVTLSRREKQVAVCVAEGLSSKQIAARLGIGLRTVNTYRESLARKIGASSGAVLTRYVLENRLALTDAPER